MQIEIRPAIATDMPRLMGMDHSCTSEYVWQLDLRKEAGQVAANLRETRLPRPVTLKYPRNPFALADEWQYKSLMLVAVGADLLGYICLSLQSAHTVTWITDLVVAAEARRQGIGMALLEASEQWALERDAQMLIFETQARNQPAIRMAHKFGLEFCGYNDHYYVSHDVALFFGRALK
jgi:GNAT superfamily N-acetyltransferase